MVYIFSVPNSLLTLNDGRTLEYNSNSINASSAVIFHQGTLTDLSGWASWIKELGERNIRAVAFNRSGYGRSSADHERQVLNTGRDVSQLADALGLTRFVSIGLSGGGPPALATGLDQRCAGVVTVGGLGPYGVDSLDFYAGMKDDDVNEYHAALRDITELLALLGPDGPTTYWCPPDAEALASPEADELHQATTTTLTWGLQCLIDDYSSYLSPWGFDVTEVRVPVVLFQGTLDGNVPPGHASWLGEHLVNGRVQWCEGEGHISTLLRHRTAILNAGEQLLRS